MGRHQKNSSKSLRVQWRWARFFSARLSVSIPHIRTMFRENPRERYYATNVAVKKNCVRGFAQAREKAYKD